MFVSAVIDICTHGLVIEGLDGGKQGQEGNCPSVAFLFCCCIYCLHINNCHWPSFLGVCGKVKIKTPKAVLPAGTFFLLPLDINFVCLTPFYDEIWP